MTATNPTDTELCEARTTRELLTIIQRHVNDEEEAQEYGEKLVWLACFDLAFRESLTDAICLCLQRQDSHVETVGKEFEPLMHVVAVLRLARLERDLRDWIDRHLGDRPSAEGEKRFALAVWTLMQIGALDSRSFVTWWTERAEKHKGSWIEAHLKPEAVPAAIPRH